MNLYLKYIFLLFIAAGMPGCLKDQGNLASGGSGATGDGVEVTMALDISDSGTSTAQTRSMTADQENDIETLDLLVFEDLGSGAYRYRYATHGYDIKNTKGSNSRSFKVMLKLKDADFDYDGKRLRFVLLANLRNEWNGMKDQFLHTTTDVQAFELLRYSSTGAWDMSASTMRYLPMGVATTSSVTMSKSISGADITSLYLRRAVAAIDVGFNYDAEGKIPQGLDNFKLKEVVVCNSNDRGYALFNLNFTGGYVVNVPDDANKIPQIGYSLSEPSATGMFRTIYLPEVNSTEDVSDPQRLFLLIGGYYSPNGDDANKTEITWYKVGFPNISDFNRKHELRRNYRYTIMVDEINGPGFGSKTEAIAGGPNLWGNMSVVHWDESSHSTEVDSPYSFDVSSREFILDYKERGNNDKTDNVIGLYTDYRGGWKADGITYEDTSSGVFWLGTGSLSGLPFVNGELTITTLQNQTDEARIGYIHLSAGRWKQVVKVIQNPRGISVTPAARTISFWQHRNGPMEQNTFFVESAQAWELGTIQYPAGAWELTVHKTNDGKGFYVQCDRNDTQAGRTAVINIISGNTIQTVVVTQDWANCGIGGVPKEMDFGGSTVMTHIIGGNIVENMRLVWEADYGPREKWTETWGAALETSFVNNIVNTSPAGEYYSCWMVENSTYGSPSATYFGTYPARTATYYSKANSAGACPPGWRVPSYLDRCTVAPLVMLINKNNGSNKVPLNTQAEEAAIAAWESNGNAYSGWRNGSATWEGWSGTSIIGAYWSSEDTATALRITKNGSMKTVDSPTVNANSWMPVRCVTEESYYYE